MAPEDPFKLIEGARHSVHAMGDALKSHHKSLVTAVEETRGRATAFLETVTSTLNPTHRPGSASSATTPVSEDGGKTNLGLCRARRSRGGAVRFLSTSTSTVAHAAELAPAKAVTSSSLVTSPPAKDVPHSVKEASVQPTALQLLLHPVALLHYVPKDAALFCAGAVAGATAKTVTAPLDRWKLMLQVKSVQNPQAVSAVGSVNLLESFVQIGKEEGLLGYWKGNLPQVLRIIPYSAVQLFAYETYKKLLTGEKKDLSVPARLAAGACAGMTSTLITYPLDVLRLRLAVEPGAKQMTVVAMRILREEGAGAFYKGLGPSLLSIAPYIALNFCAFDLVKKSIPEKYRKTPQASLFTALCATSFATVMCYPLDTVRRQMQMRNSPFKNVVEAFPGIVKRDGIAGLYRGFIANALKNLPNSSIRLTTYDTVKNLIAASNAEFQKLVEERKGEKVRVASQKQAVH